MQTLYYIAFGIAATLTGLGVGTAAGLLAIFILHG